MIELELSGEERRILREVLEEAASDLRMEIANTDSYDFREMLKERKRALRKVLEALADDASVPADAYPPRQP